MQRIALAPLFGAAVLGAAPHGVLPAPVLKAQLHAGFQRGVRIIAAHGIHPAHPARELAEQRVAHGVKQGGLARAGIARHQKQPAPAQGAQVDVLLSRIGAERSQL